MMKKVFGESLSLCFLISVSLTLALAEVGCRSKSDLERNPLPLPPVSDSGLVAGEFLQTDYGFAIPVPAHWSLLRLSEDQEVDEVARFSDPEHGIIARVTVHLTDPSQDFSDKDWDTQCQQEFKDRQLDLVKKGSSNKIATADGLDWSIQNYRLADKSRQGWLDQEWLLRRQDLLIWIHVSLDQATADSSKGKKLLETLQANLSKIHWYRPIGERGISLGLYELDNFTAALGADLQRGNTIRVNSYFDDLYPGKPQWDAWYQSFMADVPSQADLKVELTGMVINGENATVLFTFAKKEKSGGPVQKIEKGFVLSKKDGSWKIVAPVTKG
jgi:hypothetical protein